MSMTEAQQEARREYNRRYHETRYATDPDYVERKRQFARERHAERRDILDAMKGERGCLECGEKDVRVLEWHHRDPSEKLFGVAGGGTRTLESMLTESEKCDVLCANCHTRAHYRRP